MKSLPQQITSSNITTLDTPAIDGQIEQSIDYAKRLSAESRAKAEQGKGGQRQYQGQGQQQPYQQATQVQAGQQQPSITPQTVADDDIPFQKKEKQMAERRKYGKKYCKYTEMKVDFVDYKNTDLLKLSMSERG